MIRCLLLILTSACLLSGCRYWVLYEFAEQFCEFDDYVHVSEQPAGQASEVKIQFVDPILDRAILLRYLQAEPVESSVNHAIQSKERLAQDHFALALKKAEQNESEERLRFTLSYHLVDQHALLKAASLDKQLSRLFTPPLVEVLLRSLCSDDYTLSRKALDMRFSLPTLIKSQLPLKSSVIEVFGLPLEVEVQEGSEQLRYELAFQTKSSDGIWSAQSKPVLILFTFDSEHRLSYLYIRYYKYDYWLDVTNQSGRLLISRDK